MLKEEIINIKDEYVYEVKGRGIIIKDYIGKEKQITIIDLTEPFE